MQFGARPGHLADRLSQFGVHPGHFAEGRLAQFDAQPGHCAHRELHQDGRLFIDERFSEAPLVAGGSSSRFVEAGDASAPASEIVLPHRLASVWFSSIGSAIPKPLTGASGIHADPCVYLIEYL